MNATLEITLEKPGIIAVSETLRKQLGLVPGMSLIVEDASDGIRLRIKERPAHLTYENHVLVYNGVLTEPETDFVQQDREQRLSTLMS